MEFPIVITKCPVCGSEEQVAQGAYDDLVEKGKAKATEGKFPVIGAFTQFLVNPTIALLTVPVLISYLEVCGNPECGALYAKRIDRQDAPIRAQAMPGGQGAFPGP